jgi:Wadjet anti plasmid transformation system JetA-like protein
VNKKQLFDKLPGTIFRPFTSGYRLIYWRVIEDLYLSLFEIDDHVSEFGQARLMVINTIQSTIDSIPSYLPTKDEEDDNSFLNAEDKTAYLYRNLVDSGWLQEEKRGYKVYVSMPQPVILLVSALMEIAEARPLVASGALKSFRNDIKSIVEDPFNGADNLIELTRNANRFSRHLDSIRWSIKYLYDSVRNDPSAAETLKTFYGDFLKEIFVRDYVAVKTKNNPLFLRDYLLEQIQNLRLDKESYQQLLRGYTEIDNREPEKKLQRDLSRLQTVFSNVERQLDAIDLMGTRYSQRIDAVIKFAKRSPKENSRLIKNIINKLVAISDQYPDATIAVPISCREPVGEDRFYKARKPRKPPEPRAVVLRQPDDAVSDSVKRQRLARLARMQMKVTDKSMTQFLEEKMGNKVTFELSDIPIRTAKDYFHVLNLHRIAVTKALKSNQVNTQFPQLSKKYHLTETGNKFTNEYIETTQVVIDRHK